MSQFNFLFFNFDLLGRQRLLAEAKVTISCLRVQALKQVNDSGVGKLTNNQPSPVFNLHLGV